MESQGPGEPDHLNWMVCHDGSKSSCDALLETFNNMLKDRDTLTVAHVYNREKEKYLKFDLKKDYIRGVSEAICISLQDRYFYAEDELSRYPGQNVKSLLNAFA